MKSLTYVFFLLGLVGSLSLLLFLGSASVFSFDRFKVWTAQQNLKIGHGEYIQAIRVDDTVIAVALANMRLGNGEVYSSPAVDNMFSVMNEQRALLSIDIMSLLKQDEKSNKQTLNAHIRHLQVVINKTEKNAEALKEKANNLLRESEACLATKRAGDQQFFAGVQAWNDQDTQQGLQQSVEWAPCYITKRIEANASSYLASYLLTLQPYLVQRESILSNNQEQLLAYNGLFEGTILDDLQSIKKQVTTTTKTKPSSTEVEQVYSFWKFDEHSQLPTFNTNTTLFPNGKIPTFQNPGIDLSTNF